MSAMITGDGNVSNDHRRRCSYLMYYSPWALSVDGVVL